MALFSLIGGFLGGLLAQKMNIMKLMFVGALLACLTNLILLGWSSQVNNWPLLKLGWLIRFIRQIQMKLVTGSWSYRVPCWRKASSYKYRLLIWMEMLLIRPRYKSVCRI